MAKRPDRDPAKHSKKDPAKPTRAKAARPDSSPLDPSLADILNPAIGHGRAGVGSQTGSPSPPGRAGARPSASLSGEGGVGGREGKSRAPTTCASPPDPHPYPLPTRGRGRASDRFAAAAGQFVRPPRRFLRCSSGAQIDTRKISRRVGRAAASGYVAKGPGRDRSGAGRRARLWRQRSDQAADRRAAGRARRACRHFPVAAREAASPQYRSR